MAKEKDASSTELRNKNRLLNNLTNTQTKHFNATLKEHAIAGKLTKEIQRQNVVREKQVKLTDELEKETAGLAVAEGKLADKVKEGKPAFAEQATAMQKLDTLMRGLQTALKVGKAGWGAYVVTQFNAIRAANDFYKGINSGIASLSETRTELAAMTTQYEILTKNAQSMGDQYSMYWTEVLAIQNKAIETFNFNLAKGGKQTTDTVNELTEHLIAVSRVAGIGIDEQLATMQDRIAIMGETIESQREQFEFLVMMPQALAKDFRGSKQELMRYDAFLRQNLVRIVTKLNQEQKLQLVQQKDIAKAFAMGTQKAIEFGASQRDATKAGESFTRMLYERGDHPFGLDVKDFTAGQQILQNIAAMGDEASGKIQEQLLKRMNVTFETATEQQRQMAKAQAESVLWAAKQGGEGAAGLVAQALQGTELAMQGTVKAMRGLGAGQGNLWADLVIGQEFGAGMTGGLDTINLARMMAEGLDDSEIAKRLKELEKETKDQGTFAEKEGLQEVERVRKLEDQWERRLANFLGPEGKLINYVAGMVTGIAELVSLVGGMAGGGILGGGAAGGALGGMGGALGAMGKLGAVAGLGYANYKIWEEVYNQAKALQTQLPEDQDYYDRRLELAEKAAKGELDALNVVADTSQMTNEELKAFADTLGEQKLGARRHTDQVKDFATALQGMAAAVKKGDTAAVAKFVDSVKDSEESFGIAKDQWERMSALIMTGAQAQARGRGTPGMSLRGDVQPTPVTLPAHLQYGAAEQAASSQQGASQGKMVGTAKVKGNQLLFVIDQADAAVATLFAKSQRSGAF